MELAISIIHVLVAVFLVLTILLQAGKGGGVGAAFGGAGSQTVFGGRGAQTFLSKLTAMAAAVFFLTSLILSFATSVTVEARSILEGEMAPAAAPASPAQEGAVPAGQELEPAVPAATPDTPPTGLPPQGAANPAEPAAVEQAPAP